MAAVRKCLHKTYPKIYEFDPSELEFFGKKNVIINFKYNNISNAHHTVAFLYLNFL